MLMWERSPAVDEWLVHVFDTGGQPSDTRYTILACLLERALKRNDDTSVLRLVRRLAAMPDINQAFMPIRAITQRSAKDDSFRGEILAQARAAQSIEEAAGWLKLISEIGTDEGVRVAFELAERFGEHWE